MNIILLLICFVEFVRDKSECCEVGYFGKSCSDVCPKYCHNNECDRTSGICLSCVTGYYSENKTCTRCPDNCEACDSNNFCFTCKSGFRGTVCADLCSNCKPNTSCDKITGYCLDSCSEGLSGELCDMKCDSKCKSCDRFNLHECTSCEDDESGVLCKEACFSRCLKRICNASSESCTYDCLSGYGGENACNKTCLTYCKDRVCNITCKGESTSYISYGLISGLVVGAVVLVASVTVIVIIKRTNVCKGCCCSQFDESTPSQTNGKDVDETMALTSLENKDLVDTNTCSPVTPNSNSAECKNANVDDDRQARIKAAMAVAKDIGRDVDNFGSISQIFIDVPRDGQTDGYIASFGPVKCFIKRWAEFWKLVWDEQCGKVVVLSSSKDKEECMLDEYFSSKQQYGDFTVASKMERDSHSKHFKLKVLKINTDSQERDVELFHFLTWPDKGFPNQVSSFLDFHKKVNDFTTELNGRTVIHCSGGVHRSATYIALDILTKRTKPINKDDICKCLQDLEKHGLETISDQIMKLAYLAGIISEPKGFKSIPRNTDI